MAVAYAGTLETNPEANRADPDFVAGKKAIERKDWKTAIEHFKAANKRLENADLHSHLGFAFRKSGDLDSAFTHYKVALGIDPNHRGTHSIWVRLMSKPVISTRHVSISPDWKRFAARIARSIWISLEPLHRTAKRNNPFGRLTDWPYAWTFCHRSDLTS